MPPSPDEAPEERTATAPRQPIEWLDDRRRTRDILDLQEGTGTVPVLDSSGAGAALRGARRIAVVGASPDAWRPSNGVLRTLVAAGFECVPVNPNVTDVLGLRSWPTLEAAVAATGVVDIVDVFRRSEHAPGIARSAVAVGARVLWLQLGVVSWEAAEIAHTAGLEVVMDRCTAIELRGWRVSEG